MIIDNAFVGGEHVGVTNSGFVRRSFVATLSVELRALDPLVQFQVTVSAGPAAVATIDLTVDPANTLKALTLPVVLDPATNLTVDIARIDSVGDASDVRLILGLLDTDRLVTYERDNSPYLTLLP